MEKEQCSTCRFWRKALDVINCKENEAAECRRYAPRLVMAGCGVGETPESGTDWAMTHQTDWCGDWEGKK